MKVLRLFLILHTDLKWVVDGAGNSNGRYTKTKLSRDFPATCLAGDAERILHEEFGFPPELCDVRYPEKYARITGSTICDDTPELGHVEEVRTSEVDLFSGLEMKAAQSKKPEKTPWKT